MFDIRFTPQSLTDMEEIRSYIADHLLNPQAAATQITQIFEKINILENFPQTGTQIQSEISSLQNYRFLIIKNYLVFYRTDENLVSIIRVLYARRDYLALLSIEENVA
ncbi:MAG: type II toxin-antitoxin system RelE/ParE family toxin [Kiritimatiellae bacterium]|jgi:toxin ParE1/3/4|nr:type II toxin-antitoxin system RelE/ParE family toxin [Kiritimatiellia bacterium]